MSGPERIAWDRHHVLFNRRDHERSGRMQRALRRHPGLIIPLPVLVHRELHREVPPVQVPSKDLAGVLIGELDSNPSTGFKAVVDRLGELAAKDGRMSEEAFRISNNLIVQANFIEEVYGQS